MISNALKLKKRALISIVGAGGKSSFLQLLTWELIEKNKKIVLTTTTKMFVDQIIPFLNRGIIIESFSSEIIKKDIKTYFEKADKNNFAILIVQQYKELAREKFSGPEANILDKWWKENLADYFVIEADGARGKPIKAPSTNEPVIPEMTTDVIAIVGIDAIGLPLIEENVFRPQIFSQLTGLKEGSIINEEAIIALIKHPFGIFKNTPDKARRHVVFNKINSKCRMEAAEKISMALLSDSEIKIDNIIFSDTRQENCPIIKIIESKKE